MFKEKVKIWHDKKIKRKEFKVGDQVLLYNSRFKFSAGKLASKWQGPLVIQEVYRSGAIRLHGDMKGNLMWSMDNVLNIILQEKASLERWKY